MEKSKAIIRRLPRILGEYAQSDPALFCTPAHKGRGLAFFRDELARWDVRASWLEGQGNPVSDLARRFSLFYKTAHSYLLTGGKASALRVMLRALSPEERVLIPEGSCADTVTALKLFGREISYIRTVRDPATGWRSMPDPEQIKKALDRTGAGTVLIQSPDVYGFCADIPGIAEAVHSRGALLLVDASFGPHLQTSDRLPESAATYADMTCHCLFTGLNALNQAVVIHLNPCGIDPETMGCLVMEEDPDPSSLILASMDWALHTASKNTWDAHLNYVARITEKIDAIHGLKTLRGCARNGSTDHDGSRIVLDVSGRNLTGSAVMKYLEGRNILAECADKQRLLLITGPEDEPDWYARLLRALEEMPEGSIKRKSGRFSAADGENDR